jgi:Ca2+/Na+ antiporter
VFGSNIFNNFIGLGLPWLLYSVIYQKQYDALEDDGVVLSLVMLMGIIVVNYVITAACGFQLGVR